VIMLLELVFVFGTWAFEPIEGELIANPVPPADEVHNTQALGQLLYTDYFYLFQAAGMILLIAMIGAIVLTLRAREGVRRQVIAKQIGRRAEDTIEVVDVPSGRGI
nr:NADH-quinone oxidoreductase subunit J [Alphaproteobacteria bacterium]